MHAFLRFSANVKTLTSAALLGAAASLSCAPAAHAPTLTRTETFPAELDRYIARVLVDGRIPGLAIAIVRNDSVLVAKGYGVRELGRPAPVDEHTVFDIASLAKSFTATAAAILVDRGMLHWDDPVRRHLPDLALPTAALTDSATVRDFLSHGTGLDPANTMWVLTSLQRDDVLRRMRHLRVVAPFRQTMVYSNIGYSVAGEAMAAAAGTSFESLLRDLVIRPLQLASTTWTYEQAAELENVSASHAALGGVQQPIARERQRQSIAPAASVQSSVHDLAKWLRLNLNGGIVDGVRLVSDSALRELHTVQTPIATTPEIRAARMVHDTSTGYGMGWQVMDYRGHPLLWHTGNGNGQIAYMALLPRDRLGLVVLVNTWSAPLIHLALGSRILDTYLGFDERDWAGEALARVSALERAQDSARQAMVAMRSDDPPPLPLERYAGRYEHAVFGPVIIQVVDGGLTLQMGGGEIADLEYHGSEVFFTRWRDPFFREYYGAHVTLPTTNGRVDSLRTQLNRDQFTAVRR
jgi:CubicO group peptidase (beta-lactamase class C family)